MALMIPKSISEKSPNSEKKLFNSLKTLDDSYTILHSVSWQSKRGNREGDGEADFVVIDPAKGIIVIEVKGGEIEINNGQWITTNRFGEPNIIKDPFKQATESKHALLRYLSLHSIDTTAFSITHVVCLPDISIKDNPLGPSAPKEITWDRADLNNIGNALERSSSHWDATASWTAADQRNIIKLLAPTVSIRRRLYDKLSDIENKTIELTSEQIRNFQMLRRLRQAIVTGGAGTGKTLLAIERSKQLASDGFSVLLLCFNELLAEHLKFQVNDYSTITASTFHSFCLREINKARIKIPTRIDDTWWTHDAAISLIDAQEINKTVFDCIIIDEGQDFYPDWLELLYQFQNSKADPFLFIFADHHQQLYRTGWSPPKNAAPLELTVNCRCTNQIARQAAAVFPEGVETLGVDGPQPIFFPTTNVRNIALSIKDLSENLILKEGIDPSKIVILTDDNDVSDRLLKLTAGEFPFVKMGTGILIETIRRFKGLEADVIIVVLPQKQVSSSIELQYTALSRAKLLLYVYGPNEAKKQLNWSLVPK